MPFFDDLSRKISKASQTAIQKTKDMADIAKTNSVISDEEKNIENLYYQIGKLYVANHPNDYEKSLETMIFSIRESEQKIETYRRQIQDIKGVIRCEKCGAEVPANAAFCNSCGAPIPKPQVTVDPNMIHCANCGALVAKGMKFCTSCGSPVEASPADPAEHNPETPSVNEATTIPGCIVCPACGAQVPEGTVFCTECGAKI